MLTERTGLHDQASRLVAIGAYQSPPASVPDRRPASTRRPLSVRIEVAQRHGRKPAIKYRLQLSQIHPRQPLSQHQMKRHSIGVDHLHMRPLIYAHFLVSLQVFLVLARRFCSGQPGFLPSYY